MPRDARLLESLFVFDNAPLDLRRMRGGGLELHDFDFVERADFPLTVMVEVRQQSKIGVGYELRHASIKRARNLMRHLRTLLSELTGDHQRALCEVSLLTADEQKLLLQEWSRGLDPIPPRKAGQEMSISRLFEAQTAATPDAPAAVFAAPAGDAQLSYRELNARANRLGRKLRSLGTVAGDRVVICLEASLTRLVAILGVLKAGAVYVPLEPTYPTAMLRDLTDDCGARLVLAPPDRMSELSFTAAAQVVALDDSREFSDFGPASEVEQASSNLADEAAPDDLAYIIYTSGSTGRPKGVAVTHRSLRHLVEAQLQAFQIDSHSRVLQFASISFDASVSEIFTALLSVRSCLWPRDSCSCRRRTCWSSCSVGRSPQRLSRLRSSRVCQRRSCRGCAT